MDAEKTAMLIEFGKRNRTCPEWREFKAKWDGRFPEEGSPEAAEAAADSRRAQAAQEQIWREIQKEMGV